MGLSKNSHASFPELEKTVIGRFLILGLIIMSLLIMLVGCSETSLEGRDTVKALTLDQISGSPSSSVTDGIMKESF
jgi:hypothetical protein